jgi:hypothetical protein
MPAEVQLALGRIFLLLSRPEQPGDAEQYEAARAVVLSHAPPSIAIDHLPNWIRDRNRGAQGD